MIPYVFLFQDSNDVMFNNCYSPIPPQELLRQNVVNYLERERPFEIDERPSSRSSNRNSNSNTNKRRANDVLHSYIKKPLRVVPSKVVRLQIFEGADFKNSDHTSCGCSCKAMICAQYLTEPVFNDDIYRSAKELIAKINRKLSV